ncbi:hypothetical protein GN956_G406 [Arapaima gigas]
MPSFSCLTTTYIRSGGLRLGHGRGGCDLSALSAIRAWGRMIIREVRAGSRFLSSSYSSLSYPSCHRSSFHSDGGTRSVLYPPYLRRSLLSTSLAPPLPPTGHRTGTRTRRCNRTEPSRRHSIPKCRSSHRDICCKQKFRVSLFL